MLARVLCIGLLVSTLLANELAQVDEIGNLQAGVTVRASCNDITVD